MPVPFQEFLALASSSLDKPSGARPFLEVFQGIIGGIDVSEQLNEWQFIQIGVPGGVSAGDGIVVTFDPVPLTEMHEYHYLGFFAPENGAKFIRVEARMPTLGQNTNYVRNQIHLDQNENMLGHLQLASNEVCNHGRPLLLPPGFILRVSMDTVIVSAGPIAFTMIATRKLLRPPFRAFPIPDAEVNVLVT